MLGVEDHRVAFGARYDLPPPWATRTSCRSRRSSRPSPPGRSRSSATARPTTCRSRDAADAEGPRRLPGPRARGAPGARRAVVVLLLRPDRVAARRRARPCHGADNVIAAEATYRGAGRAAQPGGAGRAGRAACRATARAAMAAATARARERLAALSTDDLSGDRSVRAGRLTAVRDGGAALPGRPPAHRRRGRLARRAADRPRSQRLRARPLWRRSEWRIGLWTDVLRRVEAAYAPAPACLLGYAAWRAGRGVLARVAVDRALEAEPLHPMAGLLNEVLGLGIGPTALSAVDPPDRRRAGRRARFGRPRPR